jgi:hypothetical protein
VFSHGRATNRPSALCKNPFPLIKLSATNLSFPPKSSRSSSASASFSTGSVPPPSSWRMTVQSSAARHPAMSPTQALNVGTERAPRGETGKPVTPAFHP